MTSIDIEKAPQKTVPHDTPRGLEPLNVSDREDKDLRSSADASAAKSGAVDAQSGAIGADLTRIIDAWPDLTDETRQQILHVIDNTTNHTSDNSLTEDNPNA